MKLLKRRRSLVFWCLLVFWIVVLGLGLARATDPIGTVDPVPANFQLGQEVYLENCAACHVGLPPSIMPSQTWRSLIQEDQHYGAVITPIQDPMRRVAWNYLLTYSRPINKGEEVPFRIHQSRYFRALHPKVEFSEPATLNSCVTCHPASAQFDYRSLTPEWADSP